MFGAGDLIYDEQMTAYRVIAVGTGSWRHRKMSIFRVTTVVTGSWRRRKVGLHPPERVGSTVAIVRVCLGHYTRAYETFAGLAILEPPPHLHKGWKAYYFMNRSRKGRYA